MTFAENLKKKLETKGLSDTTVKLYLRQLEIINNNKEVKSLAFLKSTDKVIKFVETKSIATQKGYFSAVISVLKLTGTMKDALAIYQAKLDTLVNQHPQSANVRTERQRANWMDWPEIEKKYNELQTEIDKYADNLKVNQRQFYRIMTYALLSLYVLASPRRSKDYQAMYVVEKEPTDKTRNYLVLKNNEPHEFVFNTFKTAKAYGQQKQPISPELAKALKKYLAFHPLADESEFPLLVHPDGSKFKNHSNITMILNRLFGRKIGPSMLRHSYLTHKYGDELKKMQMDAAAMGHSLAEQKEYILFDEHK